MRTFKVACVQASPVLLDRQATTEKACRLIAEAGREGAKLILFPEAFIPGFPAWIWFVPAGDYELTEQMYGLLHASAVEPGDETCRQIVQASKESGCTVALGVQERNIEGSGGSLFDSVFLFTPDGGHVATHRKLVPTGPERSVWAQGDGSTIGPFEVEGVRLGVLICWENYMPLARQANWSGGVDILLAPTFDSGEPWLSTMRHNAKEGRCYVMNCGNLLRLEDIPDTLPFKAKYLSDGPPFLNKGDSCIVEPSGEVIAGTLNGSEGIVYAEVDLARLGQTKWNLDVGGHYARPDVFTLQIDRRHKKTVESKSIDVDGSGD